MLGYRILLRCHICKNEIFNDRVFFNARKLMKFIAMPSCGFLLGSQFDAMLSTNNCVVHPRSHKYDHGHLCLCLTDEDGLENAATQRQENRTFDHLRSRFLVSSSLRTICITSLSADTGSCLSNMQNPIENS